MYGDNNEATQAELRRTKSDLEYAISQLEERVRELRSMIEAERENRRTEVAALYEALEGKQDR